MTVFLKFITGMGIVCMMCSAEAVAQETERPAFIGLSHVAFLVSDLDEARSFYGDWLGFSETVVRIGSTDEVAALVFRVNSRQYVEIQAGLPPDEIDRLSHVAFETDDVDGMCRYLRENGVNVPDKMITDWDGSRFFSVRDPDGHRVDFVQKVKGEKTPAKSGKSKIKPVSGRMVHMGFSVVDPEAADEFYIDLLGFAEFWRGGMQPDVPSWINMQIPGTTDYVEYMLIGSEPTRQRLGSAHHICLQVPDMQTALDLLHKRPVQHAIKGPKVGRNNRWLANMYDHAGTRTELMEPHTVR